MGENQNDNLDENTKLEASVKTYAISKIKEEITLFASNFPNSVLNSSNFIAEEIIIPYGFSPFPSSNEHN